MTRWHITSRLVADDTPLPSICLSDFLSVFLVCVFVCVCRSLNCGSFVSRAMTDSDFPAVVVFRLFRGYSYSVLCFDPSTYICNVSLKSVSPPFFVLPSYFCRYCIMNALRRLLMHSKCHNATDPVTQNDYLVPVSNALYRI